MGRLKISSPEEMEALGVFLGEECKLLSRSLLLLEGSLGAGKTLLVQGIAKALGIKEPITSPTFVTLYSYTGSDSRIGKWQGGASGFSTGASDSALEHGVSEVEEFGAKPTLLESILEPRAVYTGQKPSLHHFDLYRLEKESDFWEQGFGEVLEDEGIIAVEWPSRLPFLAGKGLLLEIRQGAREEEREVLFSSSTEPKLVHSLLSYAPFA